MAGQCLHHFLQGKQGIGRKAGPPEPVESGIKVGGDRCLLRRGRHGGLDYIDDFHSLIRVLSFCGVLGLTTKQSQVPQRGRAAL